MGNRDSSSETLKPRGTRIEVRVRTAELQEGRGDGSQRIQGLKRKLTEVEESARRTHDVAQKAVDALKQTLEPENQEVVETGKKPKEEPVIVASYPHLFNSSKESVERTFAEKDIPVTVPGEWDKWGIFERKNWLQKAKIWNVTEFPEAGKKPEGVVFEDKQGNLVGFSEGRYQMVVSGGVEPGAIKELLKRASIEKEIDFPEDWSKKSLTEKRKWLREHGIDAIPAIRGGGTRWERENDEGTGNMQVDPRTAIERLLELSDDELTTNNTWEADRQELNERLRGHRLAVDTDLRSLTGYETARSVQREYGIERLKQLQALERTMGGPAFNNANFNQERDELNRYLVNQYSADNVLDRLLFLQTNPTGLAGLTIAERDEREALLNHLNFLTTAIRNPAFVRQNFRGVSSFTRAAERVERFAKSQGQLAQFNAFLPEATRNDIKRDRTQADQYFANLVKGEAKVRLFRELNNKADALTRSIGFQVGTYGELEERLYHEASQEREPRGQEGIFEWHATVLFEGIQREVEEAQELGIPKDWKDSERNVKKNLLYMESKDLPIGQLGDVLGRIEKISERLGLIKGEEQQEAQETAKRIDELRAAVAAKYIQRRAMLNGSMNAEKVVPVFDEDVWTDTTNKVYYERFSVDHEGNNFKDENNQDLDINLLDISRNFYDRQRREEKLRINAVEDMTLRPISSTAANPDEQWLATRAIDATHDKVDPHGVTFLTKWDRGEPIPMKLVINEWLREETLSGAHGIYDGPDKPVNPNNSRDPNRHWKQGRQLLDIRKDLIRDQLWNHLVNNLHMAAEKVDEYERAGLLSQAVNVGYHETWMDGGFSENSVVRVWDRAKTWFRYDGKKTHSGPGIGGGREQKRLGQIAFSQHTNIYFGKMLDFYPEFLTDELRGKAGGGIGKELDANFVFQSHMIGKRRGIMHHNRLSVKIISDAFGRLDTPEDVKNRLVIGDRRRFEELVVQTMANLDNIDKLNIGTINATGDGFEGGDFHDRSWARGAAIAELLEDGLISLENMDWSKRFADELTNIKKFHGTDWWGDRASAQRNFSVEHMQEYLKNPSTAKFFEINTPGIFYSGRENRIKPWMKLVIPAHFELGNWWKKWWKLPYKMSHSEKEEVIEIASQSNTLEAEAKDEMKKKYLGWGPLPGLGYGPFGYFVRNGRDFAEMIHTMGIETGKTVPTWPLMSFGEFWKQFWKYMGESFRQ